MSSTLPQSDDRQPVSQDAASRGRGSHRRAYAVLAPLFVLLILWMWLFWGEGALRGGPSGKAFGADFAMFVGAAQVLKQGGNPYDHGLLYRTEQALMRRNRLSMTPKRAVVRVGNPPIFFWALQALPEQPFQPVAYGWIIGLEVAALLGFLASLAYLGWSRWLFPSLIFLLMPEVVLGAFYGNVIGLVFAAIGASLLLSRRYPLIAGLVATVAWLKPPVGLPIVLIAALFLAPSLRRFSAGFLLGTALLLGATLLTTGWDSLALWVHGLLGYSRDMAIQPDVASLSGLYVRWAPEPVRLSLEALSLVVALGLTAFAWWRRRGRPPAPLIATAWLWFVWMLATPYAHFFDLMLLAPPILAMAGENGTRATQAIPATSIYLMLFALLLISATPFNTYLLPLPTLAIGVLAFIAGRRAETWSNA